MTWDYGRDVAAPPPRSGVPGGSRGAGPAGPTFRPPQRSRRRWPVVVVGIGVVGLLVLGGALLWARGQLNPSGDQVAVDFTIPAGATTSDVATLLADSGVIGNAEVFLWYLRFRGASPFEAGDYDGLTTNQAAGAVFDILTDGPQAPETLRVTVPEGLWLPEIRDVVLATFPEMDAAAWDDAVATVRSAYQPEGATLEGLLFPATYEVALEDRADARKLVEQMVSTFDKVADELGLAEATASVEAATGLDLTPYEVLTVASMIEAETAVPEERPKVARVIYNRLLEGMLLGIDATTLYAIGRRTDALTVDDLASTSPWNTRAVAGIPPSPINAPGRSAISAALAPDDGPWLYYVLVDTSGNHFFTDDYDDFLAAADDARARGVFQ